VPGTVVLLGTVSLFTDISSESVSAILAIYLTTVLGLGPVGYGLVDGVYQGLSALVRVAGGWAGDRSGRPKWIAAGGYALSAVSRLALIPVHSAALVTSVIGVDRLGKGIRTAPRDAMIAAASPPERLGRSFGVHRTLDTVGAVLGPVAAFAILQVLPGNYHAVFVVSFGAALIGLAALVLLVPDRRIESVGPALAQARSGTRTAVLTLAPFRRLLVAVALLGLLTVSDGFLYLALQRRSDLALEYFPLLYVGTNVVYTALAWPMGRLADQVGRRWVLLGGHVLLLAAYLCAGGPVAGTGVTIACVALLGGYYAATDGQLAALTSRLFPAAKRGRALGVSQTVQVLARLVSSLAFGSVWAGFGQVGGVRIFAVALFLALPIAWSLLRRCEPAGDAS
jgi:MFS family permease